MSITPFQPHSFPPRSLNITACTKILRQANEALDQYATALAENPLPFSAFKPLATLEAIASLRSQNIHVSLHEILLQSKRTEYQPVLNYLRAWEWASKEKASFNKSFLCTLHKKIKQGMVSKQDLGSYRNRQNWIGPDAHSIKDAYFYPPAPDQVPQLMQKLLNYCHKRTKDPLLQLVLAFAQLLIIHPFMDGNGRVARLLIPFFLYQKEEISFPIFFMSRYFFKHRLRYFQNLYRATEENHWEEWMIFFLKGVCIEARKGMKLLRKMNALYNELKADQLPHLIINFLFRLPFFTFAQFKKAGGSKAVLTKLEQKKWIKKNNKLNAFSFPPYLKILQELQK